MKNVTSENFPIYGIPYCPKQAPISKHPTLRKSLQWTPGHFSPPTWAGNDATFKVAKCELPTLTEIAAVGLCGASSLTISKSSKVYQLR